MAQAPLQQFAVRISASTEVSPTVGEGEGGAVGEGEREMFPIMMCSGGKSRLMLGSRRIDWVWILDVRSSGAR